MSEQVTNIEAALRGAFQLGVKDVGGLVRLLEQMTEPIRSVTVTTTHGRSMMISFTPNEGFDFTVVSGAGEEVRLSPGSAPMSVRQ